MLSMRPQQMETLDDFAIEAYVGRTVAHLLRYFPAHGAVLGDARLRRAVRVGWEKAKAYGFGPECCARSYAEFMCLLGSNFDTDPLLPWAAAILGEQDNFDPVARADALYDRVWRQVRRSRGDFVDPTGQPTLPRYLHHLARLDESLDRPVNYRDPALVTRIGAGLWGWMPEKCASVGEPLLGDWIRSMLIEAAEDRRTGEKEVTLMLLLAFLWGKDYTSDPLVPWEAAEPAQPAAPTARIQLRMTEATEALRRWWPMATGVPS